MPRSELLALPTSGSAWTTLRAYADASWPAPSLADQNNKANVYAVAGALVYARTGTASYRTKVVNAIEAMWTGPWATDMLAIGRQLGGWVIAADLVGYRDAGFLSWLDSARTRNVSDHSRWTSIVVTHEDANQNYGTWAGVGRIAASLYLGDTADVERAVRVVKGFLGDRSAWNDFRGQDEKNPALYADERTWACDASPGGFTPINASCGDLNGALVGDAYRGGPAPTLGDAGKSYTTESLQGLLLQVELLDRAGYDLWRYQSDAVRRAGDFLARHDGWNWSSISYGSAWLVNRRLGTTYARLTPTFGRTLVGYDWLYGS